MILGIRSEVRYVDHGDSTRTVPFESVAVVVPVSLSTSEPGVGWGSSGGYSSGGCRLFGDEKGKPLPHKVAASRVHCSGRR